MDVFGVTITGDHQTQAQHRFYGIGGDARSALILAEVAATQTGWTNISVEDVSRLGPVEFRQLSPEELKEPS